jgi:hypothetical protein
MGVVCALGDLPHSCYHATSIHLYDADYRILEHGKRKALMVCPTITGWLGAQFFNLIWYKPNL